MFINANTFAIWSMMCEENKSKIKLHIDITQWDSFIYLYFYCALFWFKLYFFKKCVESVKVFSLVCI